jgi:hypothetical protein
MDEAPKKRRSPRPSQVPSTYAKHAAEHKHHESTCAAFLHEALSSWCDVQDEHAHLLARTLLHHVMRDLPDASEHLPRRLRMSAGL